jgi:drug/metabolite transporter (DMT)-like permease
VPETITLTAQNQPHPGRQRLGELAIFFSCAVFACMSITVRGISGSWSGVFISFCRFLIGALLAGLVLAPWKQALVVYDKKAWILRGIFGSLSMLTAYLAIRLTSSGRAVLLSNTYPIFVAVYGLLFFKEKLTWAQGVALLTCFAGMVFVFYDHSRYSWWGNALGLSSGVLGGFGVHYIRKSRERNSVYSVYLSSCLFGLVFCVGAVPEFKLPAGLLAWGMLLGVGVLAFVGQSLATYGYKYVTAGRGSIIGFAETLFTLLLSFLVLGEEMKPRFWLGTVLILLGLVINQNGLTLTGKKAV